MSGLAGKKIVLFDGFCNLCSGCVQFALKRDPHRRITYLPLQSPAGRDILSQCGVAPGSVDSFVFVEDGMVYLRSEAAIRLVRNLDGPWKLLSLASVIPRFIRDRVYDGVARKRYHWFGRKSACWIPPPDVQPHDDTPRL